MKKKVVPKLRQEVKVKVDIVTSDNIKIYYTGKFQDFNAGYMITSNICLQTTAYCPYTWGPHRANEQPNSYELLPCQVLKFHYDYPSLVYSLIFQLLQAYKTYIGDFLGYILGINGTLRGDRRYLAMIDDIYHLDIYINRVSR